MELNQQVKEEFYFWLADGRVLKSASELLEALKAMSEKTYSHHVNSEKNDFANWIGDIYQDKETALKIQEAKKQKASAKVLEETLKKKEKNQEKENSKKIFPPEKKSEILNLLRRFKQWEK